ncbi:ATPase, T2SS/T4P/T4SS family [Rugosimonospora acidiphila]|uniref:ATPase, T2SS/T4P/T4SS family n=1 Tax=Rugosimonospora acidiphila TaxID=556531 RepID=A0ABP9SLF9_9ACTN
MVTGYSWPPSPARAGAGAGVVDEVATQISQMISSQLQRPVPHGPGGSGEAVVGREELVERLLGEALVSYAQAAIAAGFDPPDPALRAAISSRVRDALLGLGPLQPLLADPDVENIDINGWTEVWLQYTDGRRAQARPLFGPDVDRGDDAALDALIRQIAAHAGGGEERRFDRGSPSVSAQLPDGSRMFAVMAVGARTYVSIRRHRLSLVDLTQLCEQFATISPAMVALLSALVRAKRNIVVAGGTDTGKTTFLRALARAIPAYERLITVEDVLELDLHRDPFHPNVVALQSRAANIEGVGAIPMDELVRMGLRMNPDRVFVGEVRGAEAIPMCQAMRQGNDGSMTTLHASDSEQVFSRLATCAMTTGSTPVTFETMSRLIAEAVHVVVHLDWSPDGRRVVSSIREVTGFDGTQVTSNEVYQPGPDRRARYAVPPRQQTLRALIAVGFDPAVLDADRQGWR